MTEALISTRRNGAFINQAFKLFRDAPLPSQFGFVMVWAYIFVAVFAPVLAPHAETEIVGDHYEAWSEAFPLGTDAIGRDMLSRMIYGARNTIGIAFLAASLGFLGGGIAGMLAAMLGGWTDQALSRVNDILMAIPGLIFILLVLSFLGTSIPVLVSVIGLFEATRVFRVTRAAATNVEVMEFVEVAKLRGENLWWLIRCVVLPNITVDPSRKSGGALHWTHPGKVEAPYTVCIASASNLTGLVKSSVECRRLDYRTRHDVSLSHTFSLRQPLRAPPLRSRSVTAIARNATSLRG